MATSASVFNLADRHRFDPLTVELENDAPMNPASTPPKQPSKYQPLLDRMAVGQSCVLELSTALSFVRWSRTQPGVRLAQSKVGPTRMRVKVVSKPGVRKP